MPLSASRFWLIALLSISWITRINSLYSSPSGWTLDEPLFVQNVDVVSTITALQAQVAALNNQITALNNKLDQSVPRSYNAVSTRRFESFSMSGSSVDMVSRSSAYQASITLKAGDIVQFRLDMSWRVLGGGGAYMDLSAASAVSSLLTPLVPFPRQYTVSDTHTQAGGTGIYRVLQDHTASVSFTGILDTTGASMTITYLQISASVIGHIQA